MRQPGSLALVIAAITAAACSKSVDAPPPAQSAAARSTAAPADPDKPHHRDGNGRHEDRHDPAIAAPQLQLTVAINGATASWGPDAFSKVARYTRNDKASDGEAREVWSLRDLARSLVGPGARVTAVTGDGSKTIDRAAWDDASREPLLHTTRRGTLKFRWADAAGKWGDTEIKDVTRIEIAR